MKYLFTHLFQGCKLGRMFFGFVWYFGIEKFGVCEHGKAITLLQIWMLPPVREFVIIWQSLDLWGTVNEAACVSLTDCWGPFLLTKSNIYIIHLLQCVFINWWGNNKANKRGESEWSCLCIMGLAFNIWPTFRTPFSGFQAALPSPQPHIPPFSHSLSLSHCSFPPSFFFNQAVSSSI